MTPTTNTHEHTEHQASTPTERHVTSLIPMRDHLDGPATHARLRRTLTGLAAVSATGADAS